MKSQWIGPTAVLVVLVSASAWVAAQSGASSLEGAWAVQEISRAESDDVAGNNPSGFLVFSGGHYSQTIVGNSERPTWPPATLRQPLPICCVPSMAQSPPMRGPSRYQGTH